MLIWDYKRSSDELRVTQINDKDTLGLNLSDWRFLPQSPWNTQKLCHLSSLGGWGGWSTTDPWVRSFLLKWPRCLGTTQRLHNTMDPARISELYTFQPWPLCNRHFFLSWIKEVRNSRPSPLPGRHRGSSALLCQVPKAETVAKTTPALDI